MKSLLLLLPLLLPLAHALWRPDLGLTPLDRRRATVRSNLPSSTDESG